MGRNDRVFTVITLWEDYIEVYCGKVNTLATTNTVRQKQKQQQRLRNKSILGLGTKPECCKPHCIPEIMAKGCVSRMGDVCSVYHEVEPSNLVIGAAFLLVALIVSREGCVIVFLQLWDSLTLSSAIPLPLVSLHLPPIYVFILQLSKPLRLFPPFLLNISATWLIISTNRVTMLGSLSVLSVLLISHVSPPLECHPIPHYAPPTVKPKESLCLFVAFTLS